MMLTLQQGLQEMGLDLSAAQIADLDGYCALVRKWNKSFNLVSRQDIDRLVSRHVLDSLTAVDLIEGEVVLDVGTGAGFPGIPLAIARPEVKFELCDRLSRRTRFLHQVVNQLKMDNVVILAVDVETLPDAQQYSTAVCRAVATVDKVWDMVAPKLTPEASLLLYQSAQTSNGSGSDSLDSTTQVGHAHDSDPTGTEPAQSEKPAINLPGDAETSVHLFDVPGLEQPHCVLQISKSNSQSG